MSDWALERWRELWKKRQGLSMLLATHPDTEDLHRWEGGVWQNITPRFARTLITETGLSLSIHAVKEALFQATNLAPYLDGDRHGLDSEEPWINFTNGVYDLASGELWPHTTPWNTTCQIPHQYRDDLDLTDIELDTMPLDLYMRERVAKDTGDAGVLWQLLGSAMLPGNPSQTFTILQGPAGSGKGTYLSLLRDVIGPENVSALTLAQLDGPKLSAGLNGTLANIAGDVNGGVVPAYELILNVTGGDLINADRKYRTPIAFIWDGLLILATNGRLILPAGAGSEAGWWRRAIYIDMPHAVTEGHHISANDLREQIAPDLGTVATRAAHAVHVAWHSGRVPTVTDSMNRSRATARTSGDSVTDWAEDRLCQNPDGQMVGKNAYRDYSEWCEYYGHEPRNVQRFYGDLDSVLSRRGWGERIDGRSNTSRVTFAGVNLDSRKVWSMA